MKTPFHRFVFQSFCRALFVVSLVLFWSIFNDSSTANAQLFGNSIKEHPALTDELEEILENMKGKIQEAITNGKIDDSEKEERLRRLRLKSGLLSNQTIKFFKTDYEAAREKLSRLVSADASTTEISGAQRTLKEKKQLLIRSISDHYQMDLEIQKEEQDAIDQELRTLFSQELEPFLMELRKKHLLDNFLALYSKPKFLRKSLGLTHSYGENIDYYVLNDSDKLDQKEESIQELSQKFEDFLDARSEAYIKMMAEALSAHTEQNRAFRENLLKECRNISAASCDLIKDSFQTRDIQSDSTSSTKNEGSTAVP